MSQRTDLILELRRRLNTADVEARYVANVQARITHLQGLSDTDYLTEKRARRDAAE